MMTTSNDRETLEGAFAAEYATVDPERGPLGGWVVTHVSGGTNEVEVLSANPQRGMPCWGDASASAELVDSTARRYAAGIAGGASAQQFRLAFYRLPPNGKGLKASTCVPFVRFSAANLGGPSGGLGTEPANAVGAQAQGMRLTEIIVQGSQAKDIALFTAQGTLINKLIDMNIKLVEENRAANIAIGQQALERMDREVRMQGEVRKTIAMHETFKMLPFALPAITGRQLVPEGAQHAAMGDAFLELTTDEEMAALIKRWESRDPAKAAFLVNALAARKERRAEEDGGIAEYMRGRTPSLEDALADAAGDALPRKKNGASNGVHEASGDGKVADAKVPAPTFRIVQPHALTRDAARALAEGMIGELGDGVEVEWTDESRSVLAAEGKSGLAKGTKAVVSLEREGELVVGVWLPALARPMAGALEAKVRAVLTEKLGGGAQ